MNTPIVHTGVAEYVAAVRAQLDDLSADEIDELIGGLEADLDDALGDASVGVASPAEQFGPPAAYAAELRAAAGLPPRAASEGRRAVGARLRARWDRLAARVAVHPRWPAVRDFLLTIRPVWWVVRAVVATALVAQAFSLHGFLTFCLLLVAVVVSVELERRRTATRGRWWRRAIAAGNTLAVILAPFVLTDLSDRTIEGQPSLYVPANGIWVDGVEVRNIFPYDEQGRPLTGVQLFDENGRPLQVGDSAREPVDFDGTPVGQAPAVDGAGRQRWNVFPLRQVPHTYDDRGELRPDPAGPTAAAPPAVTPGPILVGGTSATDPAAPSPSPGTPTPATTPTLITTPTQTPGAPTPGTPTASPTGVPSPSDVVSATATSG